jgi:dihydropteroate synthase
VLNMTGVEHEQRMLELAADAEATVIMCFSGGGNVREIVDVTVGEDPVPDLLAHFEPRIERARSLGVDRIVIDPGMGFYYGNLTDPPTRARHQATVLLNSFRLRRLGLPICNAMPSACSRSTTARRSPSSVCWRCSAGPPSFARTRSPRCAQFWTR